MIKERAEEFVNKFTDVQVTTIGCLDDGNPCIFGNTIDFSAAKECAVIAIDEILSLLEIYGNYGIITYYEDLKTEILDKNFGKRSK